MRIVNEEKDFIMIACNSCNTLYKVKYANTTKTSRGYDFNPSVKCACGNVGIAASWVSYDKKLRRVLIVLGILILLSFVGWQGFKVHKQNQIFEKYYAEIDQQLLKSSIAQSNFINNYEVMRRKGEYTSTLEVHLNDSFEKLSLIKKHELLQSFFKEFEDKKDTLRRKYEEKYNLNRIDLNLNSSTIGIAVSSKGTYEFKENIIIEPSGLEHSSRELYPAPISTSERRVNIGMTSTEVKSLLGPPDEVLNTQSDSKGTVRFRWRYEGKGYLYFADDKVWQVLFNE